VELAAELDEPERHLLKVEMLVGRLQRDGAARALRAGGPAARAGIVRRDEAWGTSPHARRPDIGCGGVGNRVSIARPAANSADATHWAPPFDSLFDSFWP